MVSLFCVYMRPLGELAPGKWEMASMCIFCGGPWVSDLALVASPPAVPSGVHLSTAGRDLCLPSLVVGLDPFWGGLVARWEPFQKIIINKG